MNQRKENQTFFWTMNRDALTRGWSCNDREIGYPARAALLCQVGSNEVLAGRLVFHVAIVDHG